MAEPVNVQVQETEKPKIGRKLSRVLSIFRRPKGDQSGHGTGTDTESKEPIYEELIYDDISAPQNYVHTYGSVVNKNVQSSELIDILRLGKPFPQVVTCDGWRSTGFGHKSTILFLTEDELTPAKLSTMNLSIVRDEKAFYYRENFCHNEHLNLVGYSRVWGPLILSVMKEGDRFKMILRSISGTETREVLFDIYNQEDDEDDWTLGIFGSLAQDTFSQVVCLDTWSRLMAYDEHTVSHTHNIGVFVQCAKQFTMSALVGNSSMSRSLTAFLAAFSRPVRGVSGSLAYHTEHIGHDLYLHPLSTIRSEAERRERITQSMVQVVFQEGETPFSPEFLGPDLETMCFIIVQPVSCCATTTRHQKFKVSTLCVDEIAPFSPRLPELPILSGKQLSEVLTPLLINANINCFQSRRMNSLRCRARAELFANLYEQLSGWDSALGTYTGRKLAELIKKPVPVARDFDAFTQPSHQTSMKADVAGLKVRSDSGHSSNYYSSGEDDEGECEQCEHPKQSRKQRSNSQRESECEAQFRSKMVEVKRAASCTRIQETPEENAMAFLEPDEIARIQTFLRSQAGAQMPSAKGAALASKQSSTTSGISTQTESSECNVRSTKKMKQRANFDMRTKSVSLQTQQTSQKSAEDELMRRTTSADRQHQLIQVEQKKTEQPKKEKKGLMRKNTMHEKSAEERKESDKRQRMLARAKSLNDLNRRVHTGYSSAVNFDSSSNLSASSIDSLSDIDFTAAMDLLKPSQVKQRSSNLARSQSQAVLHPTKSIIRREEKKQKHTVSFRN